MKEFQGYSDRDIAATLTSSSEPALARRSQSISPASSYVWLAAFAVFGARPSPLASLFRGEP